MRHHAAVAGCLLAVFMLLGALEVEDAQAVDLVAGTYRCASYNVSGGGGSCRTFQPLILQPDGTYRHSSTRGSWGVRDGRLHLSESTLWGPGEILGADTLRFQYEYRGWRHTVTWVCAECAQRPAMHPPSSGPSVSLGESVVGVAMTLEFGTPIGGVSSFVIVPAKVARQYTHNLPLPDGAVQGVAWETSATAVALSTGRNKLRAGRKYVVFLSWPRESIPVAVVDLPAVKDDYTTALRATLDGSAVLASLGGSQDQPSISSVDPPPPPAPYPPTPAASVGALPGSSSPPYPAELSSAPPSAQPAGYPTPSGIPPSQVGSAGVGQPAAPRCHPLIPKYSQPGCVE